MYRTVNNKGERCNTLLYTFLPFSNVYNEMIKETPVDVGDSDYIIKDILYSKLFIPKSIPDGKKHKTFRAMINGIMHNNPSYSLEKILSFVNYINYNHTGDKSMNQKEMIRTITAEYNRIIETGKFCGLRNKKVHTNKNLPGHERKEIANRVNGRLRKNQSIQAIRIVCDELKTIGIKPTINEVTKILEGRRGMATIKKYWRIVNPKVTVVEPEISIEHIQLPAPLETNITGEIDTQASLILSRDELYQEHNSNSGNPGKLHQKYVEYPLDTS